MAPSVPSPGKFVIPVLLNPPTRQILLKPRHDGPRTCWTAIRVPMRAGMTCRRTAVRFLRRRLRLQPVRVTPVIGRLFAIDDTEKLGYVALVLPVAGAWGPRSTQILGASARWWTLRELRAQELPVEPVEVLDLVDGYWDGWLPDGEVSLV